MLLGNNFAEIADFQTGATRYSCVFWWTETESPRVVATMDPACCKGMNDGRINSSDERLPDMANFTWQISVISTGSSVCALKFDPLNPIESH